MSSDKWRPFCLGLNVFLSHQQIHCSLQVIFAHEPLSPDKMVVHFVGDISKCIFFYENFCILIQISLTFVFEGPMFAKFCDAIWRY